MRKILAALTVALTLLAGDLVWSSATEAQTSTESFLQEVIVGFEPGFLPDLGVGELLEGLPISMRSDQGNFLTLKVPNLRVVREIFALMPGVSYVEKNGTVSALATPNDPRYGTQYGPGMMGFPAAWGSIGYGSSAIKVAVIDSGVLATHQDLAGPRLLQGFDYVNGDSVPDDTCGHGTHVAGTIGATANNSLGVAGMSQASILPLKGLQYTRSFFSSGCSGSDAGIANAIYGAVNAGANIISMSIGGSFSTAIQNAVNTAFNAGVILVAAAGNDGSTNGIDYPGAYPNVIAVGALDSTKNRASYSDRGPELDIMAPGSSIISTYTGSGGATYATSSGTSMATPHVSGALALAMSCMPAGTTQSQIINALYSSAEDLGVAGFDTTYGNGLARADKLVQALCPDAPPPPNNPPVANFTATQSAPFTVSVNSTSSDPDGDPLTYVWNFGDSSGATTASATHQYAAAGVYNISLTVNDGRGGSNTFSKNVEVTSIVDPDPATPTVSSGQTTALSLTSSTSDYFRKIYVPAGTTTLKVQISNPACPAGTCYPDASLYTRFNVKPTNTSYACRPYIRGANEICTHQSPQSGWWYLRVKRRIGSGNVTLVATLS